MAKQRVLVTGGAGFIGSHVAKYHVEQGNEVWAVDNLQSGKVSNLEPHLSKNEIRFDQADLRHWEKLEEAVKWADRIYHMAAHVGQYLVLSHPIETLHNNIHCFERVLQAMEKSQSHARIILASTSEIYYHSSESMNGMVDENVAIKAISGDCIQSTYPMSKYINELTLLAYMHEKGFHGVIVRIFNTIGPNQSPAYGFVVPRFIKQALSGEPLTIYGDGLQTRSFCDVDETVKALHLLLECPAAKGEIVNVGDDHECTILQLAKIVQQKTQTKSPIRHLSYKEAYGVEFTDVRRRQPDLKKLVRLTGFHPSLKLEDCIEKILRSQQVNAI